MAINNEGGGLSIHNTQGFCGGSLTLILIEPMMEWFTLKQICCLKFVMKYNVWKYYTPSLT